MASNFSRTTSSIDADRFRGSLLMLLAATLLLGLWTAWFFLAEIKLYETTSNARLEVSRASHSVQAVVSGKVVRTNLILGRKVQVGDLLVEFEAESLKLQLGEAIARKDALTHQIDALRKEIAVREKGLTLANAEGSAAIKEAQARERVREVAASYTDEKKNRLEPLLSEGHVAELDMLEAQAEADQNRAALDAQSREINRLQKNRQTHAGDRRAELESLRSEVVRLVGETGTVAANIEKMRYEIGNRIIRAAVSGTLGEIANLVPGSYVEAGDFVAAVVPVGELKAVAYFPPANSFGILHAGQSAQLRLDGFPWTEYGSIPARVSMVATEALHGKVRVELEIEPASDTKIPLQHGLPGEVEVTVEKITPASLVLRAAGKMLKGLEAGTKKTSASQVGARDSISKSDFL